MSSPVERYLDAFTTFCRAETKLAQLGEMICRVADAMKERLPVFLFAAYGVPMDPDDFSDRDLRVNMNEWPTAPQIEEAFRNWREAWRRAASAWQAVPVERRIGLVQLPNKIPDSIDHLYYKIRPDQY